MKAPNTSLPSLSCFPHLPLTRPFLLTVLCHACVHTMEPDHTISLLRMFSDFLSSSKFHHLPSPRSGPSYPHEPDMIHFFSELLRYIKVLSHAISLCSSHCGFRQEANSVQASIQVNHIPSPSTPCITLLSAPVSTAWRFRGVTT